MFYLVLIYDKQLFYQINPSYYHMLEHMLYTNDNINQLTKSEYIVCQYSKYPLLKLNKNIKIEDEKTRIYEELNIIENKIFKYDHIFYLYNEKDIKLNKKLFKKIFIYDSSNNKVDILYEKKITINLNINNYISIDINYVNDVLIKYKILIPISNKYSILNVSKLNYILNRINNIVYIKYFNGYFLLFCTNIENLEQYITTNIDINYLSLFDYVFNYEGDDTKTFTDLLNEFVFHLKKYLIFCK